METTSKSTVIPNWVSLRTRLTVRDEMNSRSAATVNIKFPISKRYMELDEEREEKEIEIEKAKIIKGWKDGSVVKSTG